MSLFLLLLRYLVYVIFLLHQVLDPCMCRGFDETVEWEVADTSDGRVAVGLMQLLHKENQKSAFISASACCTALRT